MDFQAKLSKQGFESNPKAKEKVTKNEKIIGIKVEKKKNVLDKVNRQRKEKRRRRNDFEQKLRKQSEKCFEKSIVIHTNSHIKI